MTPDLSNHKLKETEAIEEIEAFFCYEELEPALYGFSFYMDYIKAILEFEDSKDSPYEDLKVLSTRFLHELGQNKKLGGDCIVPLDTHSTENLLTIIDLILYMSITGMKKESTGQSPDENSMAKCYTVFLAVKDRISSKLSS